MEAEPGYVGQKHEAGRHQKLSEVLQVDSPALVPLPDPKMSVDTEDFRTGFGCSSAIGEEGGGGEAYLCLACRKIVVKTTDHACSRGRRRRWGGGHSLLGFDFLTTGYPFLWKRSRSLPRDGETTGVGNTSERLAKFLLKYKEFLRQHHGATHRRNTAAWVTTNTLIRQGGNPP